MSDAIIVALITGGLSLIGVLISNSRAAQNMDAKLEKQQAITDTKLDELTREVREHKKLHKPLDKGGLPCSHRPHHANVNISGGAGGNILIDRGIHSIPSFFPPFYNSFLCDRPGKYDAPPVFVHTRQIRPLEPRLFLSFLLLYITNLSW